MNAKNTIKEKHCTLTFNFNVPYGNFFNPSRKWQQAFHWTSSRCSDWLLLHFAFDVSLCYVVIFFVMLQNSCTKPAITTCSRLHIQLNYTISRTHNTMERSQVPHASNSYGGLWVTRVVFMCVYLDIFVPSLSLF